MKRDQKTQVIEEIAARIREAEAIFAVDYRGLSVPQAAELRTSLREAGASFRVVKNTLTLRAADQVGADQLKVFVEAGPTALTFVVGDPALAAKALDSFARRAQVLDFKGGTMAGDVITADEIRQIARLPGRDLLNAQIAGVVASPLTGLVRGLGSLLAGVAIALGQVLEGRGGEQAAAEEAPAAEAPAAEEEPPAVEEPPAEEAPAAQDPTPEEPAAEEPSGDQPESSEPSESPEGQDEEPKEA